MSISGGGSSNDAIIWKDIDAGSENATDAVEVGLFGKVGIYVCNKTGEEFTGAVTLQASPNGNEWFDTEHKVIGDSHLDNITCIADYVRAKVTTKNVKASVIAISIITR